MNLLVLMGEKCQRILDREIQDVTANHIQADEIWTFVQLPLNLEPPAYSLQPPASSLQPTASSLQPPA